MRRLLASVPPLPSRECADIGRMRSDARSRGRGLCTLVLCVHAALVQSFALGTGRAVAGLQNVVHPACARQPLVRLSVLSGAGGVEQPEANGQDELRGESPPMRMQQGPGIDISKGQFGGGSGATAVLEDTDFSVNTILKQLESIQQGTPKNIVILGTRHCSFLHQQIIEVRAVTAPFPPRPKPIVMP